VVVGSGAGRGGAKKPTFEPTNPSQSVARSCTPLRTNRWKAVWTGQSATARDDLKRAATVLSYLRIRCSPLYGTRHGPLNDACHAAGLGSQAGSQECRHQPTPADTQRPSSLLTALDRHRSTREGNYGPEGWARRSDAAQVRSDFSRSGASLCTLQPARSPTRAPRRRTRLRHLIGMVA
jgi:hypothetical protein